MNITVNRAVIEQALEACTDVVSGWESLAPLAVRRAAVESLDALRTALEQPEQEPVAWMLKSGHGTEFNECIAEELKALTWKGKPMWVPLYTAPPQRKPLSDEEIQAIWEKAFDSGWSPRDFARAIEAAHGIKEEQ